LHGLDAHAVLLPEIEIVREIAEAEGEADNRHRHHAFFDLRRLRGGWNSGEGGRSDEVSDQTRRVGKGAGTAHLCGKISRAPCPRVLWVFAWTYDAWAR